MNRPVVVTPWTILLIAVVFACTISAGTTAVLSTMFFLRVANEAAAACQQQHADGRQLQRVVLGSNATMAEVSTRLDALQRAVEQIGGWLQGRFQP